MPDSDDVLVVDLEEEAFLCVGHAKEATTKTSSLSGTGRRNYSIVYLSKTAYRIHLGPSPFDTTRYEVIILGELPL